MASSITPMLTVRDAAGLVKFYTRAFSATETQRFSTPTGQQIVGMSIDGFEFFVVDENPQALNLSPVTLGGTSMRMSLIVDDPDGVMRRAIEAGATEIFPMNDQPYGMRQGRVADPAGHHWLIGKPLPKK